MRIACDRCRTDLSPFAIAAALAAPLVQMAELEAQLNNLSISNDEPSLLDASDTQDIQNTAAKAKDEVLVIVLVGLCGAGKSATAN